jgi:large subunit ribosomal protein L30
MDEENLTQEHVHDTKSEQMVDTQESKVEKKVEVKSNQNGKLAVILVRGLVNVSKPIKDTLAMLKLTRKNNCVVIADNVINRGMIKKVKDYITWGEISEDTYKELVDKRGSEYLGRETDSKKKYSYKTLENNGKKLKTYFRLNPPRKGFGRKGIKMPFKLGGGLGYRGNKIDDLLKRMI